jgi:hypothetical protein
VLARAGEVFELTPPRLPEPGQLALRRICIRRGAAVIDGNRYLRRLISLARWAFPDVWNAFGGSLPTAKAVLSRWPHLAQLATARRASVTALVAEHTREVPTVSARAEAIRGAAEAWARFWTGRLDMDELAWQVSEHLSDLELAATRIDRATALATDYWERLYGDDPPAGLAPGNGAGDRTHGARVLRRRQRIFQRETGRQLRGDHPIELVFGHHGPAQPGDHQGRARGARLAFYLAGKPHAVPIRNWPRCTIG